MNKKAELQAIIESKAIGELFSKSSIVVEAEKRGIKKSYSGLLFDKFVANNAGRRFQGVMDDLLYKKGQMYRRFEQADLKDPGYVGKVTKEELEEFSLNMNEVIPAIMSTHCENKILFLTGCTSNKSFDVDSKASNVYTGMTFDAYRDLAIKEKSPLLILSTKYGIITGDTEIENYDLSFADLTSSNLSTLKKLSKNYDVTSGLSRTLIEMGASNSVIFIAVSEKYLTRISLDKLNSRLKEYNNYAIIFGKSIKQYSNIRVIGGSPNYMKTYGGELRKKQAMTKVLVEKLVSSNKIIENIDFLERFL